MYKPVKCVSFKVIEKRLATGSIFTFISIDGIMITCGFDRK